MFLCIIMIIPLHLLPCFISGFLVYEIIISLTPWFEQFVDNNSARWIVVTLITTTIVITVTLVIINLIRFITEDLQTGINIISKIDQIFLNVKKHIPNIFLYFLPDDIQDLKEQIFTLIESNLTIIRNMGHSFLHGIITSFIGFIIGAIISLSRPLTNATYFTKQLLERIYHLSQAFRNIVFAQIKISIMNTLLTAITIIIIFPLFGKHFPLEKTLVIITFVLGLLPIVGNLISNIIIIFSALSISLTIGGIMFIYLVLIHKLEYLLNAEIIGNRIKAQPWELMLAMLMLEATFGIEGLIAAPIYYAYLKNELRAQKLI
nr:AI-2E family transporter [Blochmannia endosymbiont of Colobopsis nipponica]